MMTISCFPTNEAQLKHIAGRLKQLELFDRYSEQVQGETILVSVRTRSLAEREAVKAVLREIGISEFFFTDESAA